MKVKKAPKASTPATLNRAGGHCFLVFRFYAETPWLQLNALCKDTSGIDNRY